MHRPRFVVALALGWPMACQVEPAWTPDSLPQPTPTTLSCTPKPPVEGRCADRCGSYQVEYEQLEGDCGQRPMETATLNGDPKVPGQPCRGGYQTSSDGCESSFDVRCPTKDGSGTTLSSIEVGKLHWSPNGSSAEGELELWLFHADGDLKCKSQYRTTIVRH